MRRIVTIAVSVLLLSGCIAQWPSNRTGPRFTGGPDISPISAAPSYSGGDAIGQIHGIGN
jgi:Prokaryotic membrane lipoprotein lipid attachment site